MRWLDVQVDFIDVWKDPDAGAPYHVSSFGLERLSPLAVVAIGGLMVSTFLTMVYVPVFYSLFDDAEAVARRLAGRVTARPAEA